MNYARLTLILLFSLGLSACFFGRGDKKCTKPQEYQESRSSTTIEVPEGLSRPTDRVPMEIPPIAEGADPRPADAPCLEEPPSYSG